MRVHGFCSSTSLLRGPDIDLTASGADDREATRQQCAAACDADRNCKRDAKLVTLLRNAVAAAQDDDGWARVGAVGQQIGNQASFDPRNYGYATLTKLLKATDLFQLDKGARERRRSRCAGDIRQAARRRKA